MLQIGEIKVLQGVIGVDLTKESLLKNANWHEFLKVGDIIFVLETYDDNRAMVLTRMGTRFTVIYK